MSIPARRLAPARANPAAHAARPRPRLRVVRRRRTRAIRKPWSRTARCGAAATVMFLGVVVGVLLEQVVLAQSAFELSDLRSQLSEEEARHEELLLEAATLESPVRIEGYAREQLGMVDPPAEAVEYIVADVPQSYRPGGIHAGHRLRATGAAAATATLAEGSP